MVPDGSVYLQSVNYDQQWGPHDFLGPRDLSSCRDCQPADRGTYQFGIVQGYLNEMPVALNADSGAESTAIHTKVFYELPTEVRPAVRECSG